MAVKAGYLLLAGGGGVLLWSGVRGKSVSSVFRQLAGGDAPSGASPANPITGASPLTTSSGVGATGSAATMLAFMESKIGHGYSEDLSLRTGPNEYDCSGLVWAAANSAGIKIPTAQSNTTGEIVYFPTHGWTPILTESSIQPADICFFVGADPHQTKYGPVGHVGMCSSAGTLVSAYDTASGVCYTPMSQDHFVVGFRQGS